MADRVLDPNHLLLFGAAVDWIAIVRRQQPRTDLSGAIRDRGLKTAAQVQLRWLVNPNFGLPTQPFQVWSRPHANAIRAKPIEAPTSFNLYGGRRAFGFSPPLGYLEGTAANTGTTTGLLIAFSGAPSASAMLGYATVGAGNPPLRFRFGGGIASLVVVGDLTVTGLAGLDGANVANDPSWRPLEVVGLPVQVADWASVFGWGQNQGPVVSLVAPVTAALDRYRRGAPFLGWPDAIAPGVAAPPWVSPDPKAIVQTLQLGMLGDLRTAIATLPPTKQADFHTAKPLALQGGSGSAATEFSPITALLLGVASDPQAALIAGFGTAYELPADAVRGGAISTSPDDFMVTAAYAKGLDGTGAGVEYAAVLFTPGPAPGPPPPDHLVAPLDGLAAPTAIDGRYRALVRLMWDALPQATPFRIASFAAARVGLSPAGPVVPLMQPRIGDPGKALQPISATTGDEVAATGKLRASDDSTLLDPAVTPNAVRYAIAQQDPFGVWSAWTTADLSASPPPVQTPRLLSARLDLLPPPPAPASVCGATLVVDLTWDWTVRRPKVIRLAGLLYPAAEPGPPPPGNPAAPAGLPTSLAGGPGTPFLLSFLGGDAPVITSAVTGGTVAFISDDGKSLLATPTTVAGPRRYRLTIPGFQLDFAGTGHIGLALWAQGTELLPPQNTGDWSPEPFLTSASDPRPPVIATEHEDVQLTSLPDARGEHRARLSWPTMGGAAGYFVYHATESKFRIAASLGEPPAGQTLAQRLKALRDAFEAKPLREPFTRLNSTALPGASTDTEVVIERGSKELHLYLVIGVSAGLIESAWPNLSDPKRRKRFQAFAAPQVVPPTMPRLEVVRTASGTNFGAKVTVTTRPGAPVIRLDLFRTRVPAASLELDTMGPAVAQITADGPAWKAVPQAGQALGTVTGVDFPGGTWKRVFYRAAAISGDDPARGIYGGRSPATGAISVVVPPATPPDLIGLAVDLPPDLSPLIVRFSVTAPAPVETTELGPHRLRAEAFAVAADGGLKPLFAWPGAPGADDRLSAVPVAAPTTGLWRDGTQYHLRLTRPSAGTAIRLRLVLTDPLGRARERMLDSPGKSS